MTHILGPLTVPDTCEGDQIMLVYCLILISEISVTPGHWLLGVWRRQWRALVKPHNDADDGLAPRPEGGSHRSNLAMRRLTRACRCLHVAPWLGTCANL